MEEHSVFQALSWAMEERSVFQALSFSILCLGGRMLSDAPYSNVVMFGRRLEYWEVSKNVLMNLDNRIYCWSDGSVCFLTRVNYSLGTYREAAFRLVCQGCEFEEGIGREQQAVDQMKVLTDQMEAIKIAAVEEFKLSDAYDDSNTKYFLSGFELLRKKSKGKYPDFDFYVF